MKSRIFVGVSALILMLLLSPLVYSKTVGCGGSTTITTTCSDSDGNLDTCEVTSPCSNTCSVSGSSATCSCNYNADTLGDFDMCGRATDTQGATSGEVCLDVLHVEDQDSPTTQISADTSSWHNSDVSISVDDSDTGCSGLSSCSYRIDDGNDGSYETGWTSRSCPDGDFTVQVPEECGTSGQDECLVEVRATDGAGNTGNDSATIDIDVVPPSSSVNSSSHSWTNQSISVEISSTDSHSGYNSMVNCWTESSSCTSTNWISSNPYVVTQTDTGNWTLCYRAKDNIGNLESYNCDGKFKIDKLQPDIECDGCWAQEENKIVFEPNINDPGGSGLDSMRICRSSTCYKEICSSSSGSSCVYNFQDCHLESDEFWIFARDVAGNSNMVKGGKFEIKGEAECVCSYDNECLSGICSSGACLASEAPRIYFD